ncbi:unnamed protein product [Phyllotreta striolata]|uniref:Argonaute 3 n=1 Tax=Phyllotreta striolata TaxID=444603 RepID=A0A9N9TL66_PHYSR|nr:unnamed protein product [Phyllotreta striolata]
MDQQPPKGRGAAILARLQAKKLEKSVGAESEAPPVEEPPKPKGRAAILQRIKDKKLLRPGTSSQDVESTAASVEVQQEEVESVAASVSSMSFKEKEPVHFKGEDGKPILLSANYIKLIVDKNKGVFEYEVKFTPELDAKNKRLRCVHQVTKECGLKKVFDGGSLLYLPEKITDTSKVFTTTIDGPESSQEVAVTMIYKRKKNMGERECLHLYNVLFKRIMHTLLYHQIGRNYFDTKHNYLIPQHKLEIYPGFAVSVDELEDGLMICLDTQHKVIRTQTVYELLNELKSAHPDMRRFKEQVVANVIGSCIFTRYSNKTYTIQDVAWDMTPKDTFPTRDGGEISFIDYFKRQYDITIRDLNQPLLIHRKSVMVPGSSEKVERMVCLIPEISYLTGMSDNMRNDFTIMKDVAQFTRVTPNQRIAALKTYLSNVKKCEQAQEILADWGLKVADDSLQLPGRQLENELVYFGDGKQVRSMNGDWSRAAGDNKLIGPVDMTNWMLFYTQKDTAYAENFVDLMCRLAGPMGCIIKRPKMVKLPDDRTDTYLKSFQENIRKDIEVCVFICPTARSDRYNVIKNLTCVQYPVACQVINSRTLSNQKKVRGIVQKIAQQMTCKLGGTLWTVRFPFKGWMICGMDVYHGGPNGQSVFGLVASLNESISRWFSVAVFQQKELSDHLKGAFTKALEMWRNVNGFIPKRIVVVRDGVGDGQLEQCKRYEIEQMESILKQLEFDTTICFIVVQKRINTRLFALGNGGCENPPSGTIMDNTITRRYLHDFFLVPQSVRQGTVNPTHYIVLHDTCGLKPDHVQRLCYKLCHLYYNWSGTIRVPAPCQYAHKLASLVGQNIKKAPSNQLSDKLFYL